MKGCVGLMPCSHYDLGSGLNKGQIAFRGPALSLNKEFVSEIAAVAFATNDPICSIVLTSLKEAAQVAVSPRFARITKQQHPQEQLLCEVTHAVQWCQESACMCQLRTANSAFA